ncbi:Glutamyl-tRNA(Gln) amidotransferase subunit B, mitochondrial [Psilocybe cubensis]|uniref:Glutamyl-tRNA(Gln) amidotransferase subunit B, mitochondrial n=2 Tax=Psilocybe cubensis TaxID=181762 RepID=A0ACB8H3M9_PSICU|nr:Glutamyl-tRNA(Gln) amidotransferase subunit B, mitochondrial [Psilocybe cubensis]KAH9482302.1 Glutamyl-tRNA(Gln) amidotransferase subunit B, mitochondrial [Psilocybe cubensis]
MLLRRVYTRSLNSRAFHDLRTYQDDPRWPGWQVIIGIETHAQIKSRRKLFSDTFTPEGDELPNTKVSPFDAAFPGTLPKVNPKCVDLAIRTALALRSKISMRSSFDRKHYFYSDQPLGYQITQQYSPIATHGVLELEMPRAAPIKVRIKQIQLEQDTAKSTFNPRLQKSYIDLNRAGAGLMEIVSEPDLRSPEEAGAYVRTLQSVLRAVGSSDGNMEQGSLRCDVNVSVNRKGEVPGTRCEIKNLNSVKYMMAAIVHEIKRQTQFLDTNPGATVPQETRGFNENTFETYRLRSKEDAPDYRYMPDPNLGVLVLSQARIDDIKTNLPSLPWDIRSRLVSKYPSLNAKEKSLNVLINVNSGKEIGFDGENSGGAVEYFEELCQTPVTGGSRPTVRDPVVLLNWLTHELLGQLASRKETFSDNPLSASQFGELVDLVQDGTITGTSGKHLLRHMLANPSSRRPREIATELQLVALTSTSSSQSTTSSDSSVISELEDLCRSAVSNLPCEVAALRAGNKNVLNKIVGYVMKKSRGRADATATRELVEKMVMQDGCKLTCDPVQMCIIEYVTGLGHLRDPCVPIGAVNEQRKKGLPPPLPSQTRLANTVMLAGAGTHIRNFH